MPRPHCATTLASFQPECGCGPSETAEGPGGLLCCDGGSCTPRLHPDAHPAQHANDGDQSTYWQSPANQPIASLTIDLLSVHEVPQIDIHFRTTRPKAMVVQRSMDGETWQDWQVGVDDGAMTSAPSRGPSPTGVFPRPAVSFLRRAAKMHFKWKAISTTRRRTWARQTRSVTTLALVAVAPLSPGSLDRALCCRNPETTSEILCVTSQSTTRGNVVSFYPLDLRRPPTGAARDYTTNLELQAFARARYIRFAMRDYHGTTVTPLGQRIETEPYYQVTEVEVSQQHPLVRTLCCSTDTGRRWECEGFQSLFLQRSWRGVRCQRREHPQRCL